MRIFASHFITSAVKKEQWINDNCPEILLLGRSNVGKSTFINQLCNNKNLAKVSNRPGKTQMLNFFDVNEQMFRIVDCPGYGFAKISRKIQTNFMTMMETYLLQRKNLKLAILLLDLRRTPNNDDMLMFNFLKNSNIKILIVATKLDKLKKNDINKQENIIINTLNISNDIKLIKTSALHKKGYDLVLKHIMNYVIEKRS